MENKLGDRKAGAYDAVLIGGGHNGLVCAFYLARAGLKVRVLERRGVVGGAAVTEEFHPGFRNSTASYTVSLLNPKVIADMKLKDRGLRIVKRPISNFLPTEDGRYLKVGGGVEKTQAEIAKFSAKDAARLPAYYDNLERVADVLRSVSEKTPPNPKRGVKAGIDALSQLWPVVRGSTDLQRDILDLFTKDARSFLNRWFESDPIKAAFGFDAVVGNYASPDTPGSAYVLLHHVFGEVDGEKGVWGHAIGGMGAITQAMAAACRELGVEISLDAAVSRVSVGPNGVEGVELEGGETVEAQRVIANVNPRLLYTRLIAESDLDSGFLERMREWKSGSGTVRMNVALSELHILVAEFLRILLRLGHHFRGEVHADHAAIHTGLVACHEAVVAGAAAQVEHGVTGLDAGELRGQAAAQAEVGIGVVAFHLGVVIGHDVVHLRTATTRATAAARVGILILFGDLRVLGADHVFRFLSSVHVLYVLGRVLRLRSACRARTNSSYRSRS